ncbi:CTLH/CRA C-terminal to lish motif domain-containing protein [Dunaliella salina]|uniref:CTLH/CRA C-terminal to lish motif domain-containing protein n=1 Tax=Dunaliella salina TaxID=3046 RepID=A0ABQ7H8Y8_DUNSA|nr:CTLH/CRA C-terminal to lish motif domain-containing protein [Dunaliella salina]|eukprot:KAF5843313.1 CTLH/CRA C-terminal to lish motif domain-containing protein [Dunaliella salina]
MRRTVDSRLSREKWEGMLSSVVITKQDMNKLVMDYLVTEGHVEAARLFEQESGTTPNVELSSITDRMEVRRALQSGSVEEAIDRVNDINPEILESHPELLFHLQQQRLIELIRSGRTEEALSFAAEFLAPQGEESPAFLEELERTVALLAFSEPHSSPVGDLMQLAQRQKTASELNAAILTAQAQEHEPRLPMLLRLLQWAQSQLEETAVFPQIKDLSTAELTGE